MNLVDIAKGWWNYSRGESYTKNLMEKRLEICGVCPHKVQISTAGKILIQLVNEDGNLFQCGLCGCPLDPLTANPTSRCKDNRWLPAGEESYY